MMRSAIISACGLYRYTLERAWHDGQHSSPVAFVMLNPSTADASDDDPTIRRCIAFAKGWGFNALTVLNLYALRATDPRQIELGLKSGTNVVGPENNEHISASTTPLFNIVLAWGAFSPGAQAWREAHQVRVLRVLELVRPGNKVWTIGALTKDGAPRHPLYLKADEKLRPWEGA